MGSVEKNLAETDFFSEIDHKIFVREISHFEISLLKSKKKIVEWICI